MFAAFKDLKEEQHVLGLQCGCFTESQEEVRDSLRNRNLNLKLMRNAQY